MVKRKPLAIPLAPEIVQLCADGLGIRFSDALVIAVRARHRHEPITREMIERQARRMVCGHWEQEVFGSSTTLPS